MTAKAATGDEVFNIIEVTDFHGALVSSDAVPLPVGGVLAKTLKLAGADVIILFAHSGLEGPADTIPENQIKAIAIDAKGNLQG